MKNLLHNMLCQARCNIVRIFGLLVVLTVLGIWGLPGHMRAAYEHYYIWGFIPPITMSYAPPFEMAYTDVTCGADTVTTVYSGSLLNDLSVKGTKTDTTSPNCTYVLWTFSYSNSPFIYVKNAPEGAISVAMDSKLNQYFSKPLFNQKNGWVLESKEGKISVSGKEENNLFYELVINQINLTKKGRNFSSKEEVISFLQNSDFFERLGFSGVEKSNSLNYFIPKIKSAEKKSNYYLTILSDSAIENISTLSIKPEPKNLVRRYFALYPTDAPVQAEGNLVFPADVQDRGEYSVKETGEILVYPEMAVSWSSGAKTK